MARYTQLTDAELTSLLDRYGMAAADVTPLPGGMANSSYLVRERAGRYVLTVLDNHDAASAQRLTTLLDLLVRRGVPTSRPLPAGNGSVLQWWHGSPVLLKEFLPGRCETPLPTELALPAGELLGQVHALDVPEWLPRRGRRLPDGWSERVAGFADQEFADWLRAQWLLATPVERLDGPYGLVHGDFYGDNLVVGDDGRLAVLDWETACHELLVLDVGMTLLGLARVDGRFDPDRAVRLLEGYGRVRALTADEHAVLLPAIRYSSVYVAYHRYLRHHVTRPDPAKQHLYRELPRFVSSLDELWPGLVATVGRVPPGAARG